MSVMNDDSPMPNKIPNDTDPSNTVVIYTDGSCLGNPGPGGWAAKMTYQAHVKRISGGFKHTTNNRMELLAVIMALKELNKSSKVSLFTDSRYVVDAIKKRWLNSWQRRNWKKADGKPALNQDLWKMLVPLLKKHDVDFNWVEGHSGNPHNEEVDDLAKEAASADNLSVDEGFNNS